MAFGLEAKLINSRHTIVSSCLLYKSSKIFANLLDLEIKTPFGVRTAAKKRGKRFFMAINQINFSHRRAADNKMSKNKNCETIRFYEAEQVLDQQR